MVRKYLSLTVALLFMTLVLLVTARDAASNNTNATNQHEYIVAKRAVCHYFPGRLCREAMAVVKCETGGTYSTWASNGQYVNIFQMGSHERSIFGWHILGSSVWKAAKAARAYYNYEIRHGNWGWHPWDCRTAI